jgi:hypothetical protein
MTLAGVGGGLALILSLQGNGLPPIRFDSLRYLYIPISALSDKPRSFCRITLLISPDRSKVLPG